jgi:hypothetical protein
MNADRAEEVKQSINDRYDAVYHHGSDSCSPNVCIACDRILSSKDMNVITVAKFAEVSSRLKPEGPGGWNYVEEDRAQCYKYRGEGSMPWMEDLLLSPRACYVKPPVLSRKKEGIIICSGCKQSLCKGQMPRAAIANNYSFGTPPQCLLELTDVELALITPVKAYGYTFTYCGGRHTELKGTMSFFKSETSRIARAVTQLDVLGLKDKIVVLLSGKMTPVQRETARKYSKIRVSETMTAIEWMIANHYKWKDVDLSVIKQELETGPIVIDESTEVEGSDDFATANIESNVTFTAYFPDGSMSNLTGGQEKIEQFQKIVADSKLHADQDVYFHCDLQREAVRDFADDNFSNASMLQFPFGRGGMHEQRMNPDGSFTERVDLEEYLEILSRVSQPHFHAPLFVLISYSLYQKQLMVKRASLRLRGKANAAMIANGLDADDVSYAMNAKSRGVNTGTNVSRKFINMIDAVTKATPHSNGAAKTARSSVESLHHHLAMASYFLTVTPDDDNSWLVQVFCNEIIDEGSAESQSDEELQKRAKLRTELRMKYPGIAALCFEELLQIVMEEVVGWDMKKDCATEKAGLFGTPTAVQATIEEQGRRTLHAHILVWIGRNIEIQKGLQSPCRVKRDEAKQELVQIMDVVATTSLLQHHDQVRSTKVYDHDCLVDRRERTIPRVVADQQLRNLRSKKGYKATDGVFAKCEHCEHTWKSETLIESFLLNHVNVRNLTSYPDRSTRRLEAMCIDYQKPNGDDIDPAIINAAYNRHSSEHAKSCFKKNQSKKRKNANMTDHGDECRHRMPRPKRQRTCVDEIGITNLWCKWDGSREDRRLYEVKVKRNELDAFMNTSCMPISTSKLTCNTNITPVTEGPIAIYISKYATKKTQEDDGEEYNRVAEETRKMLSQESIRHAQQNEEAAMNGEEFAVECERKKAMRRLLRGAFAASGTDVVSAPMAAYLLRNKTRFYNSHTFVYCPFRDLDALMNGDDVNVSVQSHGSIQYFENQALHYLCRPSPLRHLGTKDFFEEYEVVNTSTAKRNGQTDIMFFENTESFQHPSLVDGKKIQCVRRRTKMKVLLKVCQWEFPDTIHFEGSILNEGSSITEMTEKYCRKILMLFFPFSKLDDLLLEGSHTKKLRHVYRNTDIIDERATNFLQNIQDCRSNCLRVDRPDDDLAKNTLSYQAWMQENQPQTPTNADDDCDSEEDDVDVAMPTADNLDLLLGPEYDISMGQDFLDGDLPSRLCFRALKHKGTFECGSKGLAEIPLEDFSVTDFLFSPSLPDTANNQSQRDIQNSRHATDEQSTTNYPSRRDIVKVIVQHTERRQFNVTTSENPVFRCDANGSAISIIDWGKSLDLDIDQQRAFEVIASSFVLTFHKDLEINDSVRVRTRDQQFTKETLLLKKLAGIRGTYDVDGRQSRKLRDDQLILLLHGAGGSGKSTVLDLVSEYSKEYCGFLEWPFTSRTIVVTAMSGVAATLLLGETTHSALALNQKEIRAEQVTAWEDARLVIIDEISFASKYEIQKIHKHLGWLLEETTKKFGGINIIFSGDFRQMEPCMTLPIYSEEFPEFHHWINSYIELRGMHRFKDDPVWGEILSRIRNGTVTVDDIEFINERVITGSTVLPPNIQYATYYNRDRDSINTGLFDDYCRRTGGANALLILCDQLEAQDSSKAWHNLSTGQKQRFWQNCGEDDAKTGQMMGRMDPVLKCYPNCPQMMTFNESVLEGKANGSRTFLQQVVLKQHEQAFNIKIQSSGATVKAVTASQVDYMVVKHANEKIRPPTFKLKPKKYSFVANLPLFGAQTTTNKRVTKSPVIMKGIQLPLVSNNATTGHKLQGSTVDSVFVHAWVYEKNWAYVVLSRVRTLQGLYLRHPLAFDLRKYAVPPKLTEMLLSLENRHPHYFNDQDYQLEFEYIRNSY